MTGADVAGLPINLPDGVIPLAALVVLKVIDADGDPAYCIRPTESLTVVEALGMIEYTKFKLLNGLEGD